MVNRVKGKPIMPPFKRTGSSFLSLTNTHIYPYHQNEIFKMSATIKYLLIAVGVIVLMLIGILMNTQVSNWNEARKAAAAEYEETRTISNPFVGSWLLDYVKQLDSTGIAQVAQVFKTGLIIYSADGYMSAILTYVENHSEYPGLDVGYCGKYNFNLEASYVNHLRDVIAINNETENQIFIRDYHFSDDGNYLTLSPREDKWKGTSLTWKKVE